MKISMLFLEGGNYDGIIYLILGVMFGPPLLLALIGFLLWRASVKKAAKVFFILAGVYLIVGLGICGALISGI
ncbi:hypothetical protein ACE939_01225 [Aquimarina sp. W85]|uniref:hypothetical protein n=1 Tax=Aquimarina rhodophyticola TaxID=3342246 RepID=UPI0036728902